MTEAEILEAFPELKGAKLQPIRPAKSEPPRHRLLTAEELHQYARKIEHEAMSCHSKECLSVSVPGAQVERFWSMLSAQARQRIILCPSEGFVVGCCGAHSGLKTDVFKRPRKR